MGPSVRRKSFEHRKNSGILAAVETSGFTPMMRQYELVERVSEYKENPNEALLNKAYVYAMQKHGTQVRASGDPYFSHPLEVAAILTELKLDEETIAIALLHDTIEDTDATRKEIDERLGRKSVSSSRG